MTISRKSGTALPALPSGSNLGIVIGLVVLAAALVFSAVLLYKRTHSTVLAGDEPEDPKVTPVAESPESIMDAILALDDQYKEGKIPEEPYRNRRNELKNRLREAKG
jgi:hypothetical protein